MQLEQEDSNENFKSSYRGQVPLFKPSFDEFCDFKLYVNNLLKNQAVRNAGLVRIKAPLDWVPNSTGYIGIKKLVLNEISAQKIVSTKNKHMFVLNSKKCKLKRLNEFKQTLSLSQSRQTVETDYEIEYWRQLSSNRITKVKYGIMSKSSLIDKKQKFWNIQNLDTILNDLARTMPGINTRGKPYLYFGLWMSSFAWHTEDMDLFSINYLHLGKPKFWYAVPPEYSSKFEELAKNLYPFPCEALMRHKFLILNPELLNENKIPYYKAIHRKGEFIITLPRTYHSGFNSGFNCAESINFAMPYWIPFGKTANHCTCPKRVDIVFDVEIFNKYVNSESDDNKECNEKSDVYCESKKKC